MSGDLHTIALDGSEVLKGVDQIRSSLQELKAVILSFSQQDPTGRVRAEMAALSTSAVTVVQSVEKALAGVSKVVSAAMENAATAGKAGGRKVSKAVAEGLDDGGIEQTVRAQRQRMQLEYERMISMGARVKETALRNLRDNYGVSLFPDDRARLRATEESLAGYRQMLSLRVRAEREAAAETTRALQDDLAGYRQMLNLRVRAEREAAAATTRAWQDDLAGYRQMLNLRVSAARAAAREVQATNLNAVAGAARAQFNAAAAASGPYSSIAPGPKFGSVVNPTEKDIALMERFGGSMRDAHSAARGLASGFNAMWLTWGALGPLLAGAAVSHAFVQAVKQGAAFEQNLEAIGYLAGASSKELDQLSTSAIQLARVGPFGPVEIAGALKTLALAGLSAREQLEAIKPVLNFAVAGEMPLEKAAESLVAISTAFGYSSTGFSAVSDVIAKAAAVSMTSVASMTESFRTASTVAQQLGVSVQDAATTLALLSQVGIKGTAAGTSLRNMYMELIGTGKEARRVLKDVLQLEVIDNATKAMKPLAQILAELSQSLRQYDFRSQLEILQKLGNERGMKSLSADLTAFVTAVKASGKDITTEFQRIQQELENAPGFTAIAAAGMAMTTANQMKSVGAALQASLVEAFGGVNTEAQVTARRLRDVFNSSEFKGGVQDLVSLVASLTEKLFDHGKELAAIAVGYVAGKAALAGFAIGAELAAAATTLLGTSALAASGGLRLLLVSLGPIGAIAAVAATAYVAFGDKVENASERAGKAAAAHSANMVEALDKEIERLQKQMQARREGTEASLSSMRVEGELALSRLEALQKEERAAGLARHAVLLLNRERLAGTEYAQTGQGSRALSQMDKDLDQSRLGMADVVIRQLKQENELREKMRVTMNLARQDAREADADAKARRQVETGTRKFTSPEYSSASHAYQNELKAIQLLISANKQRASEVDEQARVEEALLKQKYDRGVISYTEYERTLTSIQREHEEQRLRMLESEREKVASEMARLQKLAGALNPKSEPAQRYANDLEHMGQELNRVNGEITKIRNNAAIRSGEVLTKMLAPGAEMVRNAEKEGAALQQNFQQEMQRLQVKEQVNQLSERELYIQEEVARATDKASDALAKYMQVLKSTIERASPEDFNNPDFLTALAKQMEVINQAAKRLDEMRGTARAIADEAFDARRINDMARGLRDGLTDAILNAGHDGGKGIVKVLQDELLRKPFRMVVQAFLQPISQGVASVAYNMMGLGGQQAGSGLANMLGAGSGVFGGYSPWVNTAASLMGAGSTAGASALSLGYANTVGAVGGDALGAMIASNGSWAGVAAGTELAGAAGLTGATAGGAAAGSGLAGALSAVPGVGWVAAAALLAGSLLGGRGETRSGGQYHNTDFISGPSGGQIQGDNVTAAISATTLGINSLLTNLGSSSRVKDFYSGLESSKNGKGFAYAGGVLNTGAEFGQGADGQGYMNRRGSMSPEEAMKAFQAELAQATLQALQAATDIPKAIQEALKDVDVDAMADKASQTLLANVTAVADIITLPIAQLKDQSWETFKALGELSGGMEKLRDNVRGYYENFYSDEERRAQAIRNIQQTLNGAGLGVTFDQVARATRQDFRRLAESLDLTTDAGKTAYAAMMSVAGAFASITQAMASFSTAAQVQTDLQKARSDLDAALEQTKQDAYEKTTDVVNDQISALNDAASKFKDLGKSIREFRDNLLLGDLSPLTPGEKYAEAQRKFSETYTKAMGGDAEAMGKLEEVSTDFLQASRDYYASSQQYQDDFQRVQQALLAAANKSDALVSNANQQISIAKDHLKQLELANKGILSVHDAIVQMTQAVAGALAAGLNPGAANLGALTQGVTGQWVTTGVGSVYASAAGAAATGGKIYAVNGGVYTPQDVVTYITNLLNEGRALDAYYAFKQAGISLSDADMIMGWASGTAEGWARSQGLQPFALGGLASGRVLVGERGPEIVDFDTPGRVYPAEQTRGMFSSAANPAVAAQIAELVQQHRQVAEKVERLIEQSAQAARALVGAVQTSGERNAEAVVEGTERVMTRAAYHQSRLAAAGELR